VAWSVYLCTSDCLRVGLNAAKTDESIEMPSGRLAWSQGTAYYMGHMWASSGKYDSMIRARGDEAVASITVAACCYY